MKWHLKHKRHGARPWAVQTEAMKRSEGQERYGYHLQQGLGKSPLTFNDFVDSDDVDIMAVVAPQSFKGDWPGIPAEWGVPEITSGMWPRDPFPTKQEKHLYAINYEAIRTGAGQQLEELLKRRRVMLVWDETTSLKNPQSQTSKAALRLSRDAHMVRVLNGTPIVSNCMDVVVPLKCLGHLDGTNPWSFKNRFAVLGGWMGKQIKGLRNEEEFYALLDRAAFRALKEDWRKDLPPKIYPTPIRLDMTKKQRRMYSEMLEEFFTEVDGVEVSADMVLVQLGKLQQISSCLAIHDGIAHSFEEPKDNPKLKAAIDIIESGSDKAILVYFFKATGAMLIDAMVKAGLNPACIQGGMKPDEIVREKERFNDDPSCRVLVGQESATARGHTLVGGEGVNRCSRMIFVEQSFSLMERLQIEDRIHRGEQDKACVYYDLSVSSIDDKVSEILRQKKSFADSVDDIVAVARREHRGIRL